MRANAFSLRREHTIFNSISCVYAIRAHCKRAHEMRKFHRPGSPEVKSRAVVKMSTGKHSLGYSLILLQRQGKTFRGCAAPADILQSGGPFDTLGLQLISLQPSDSFLIPGQSSTIAPLLSSLHGSGLHSDHLTAPMTKHNFKVQKWSTRSSETEHICVVGGLVTTAWRTAMATAEHEPTSCRREQARKSNRRTMTPTFQSMRTRGSIDARTLSLHSVLLNWLVDVAISLPTPQSLEHNMAMHSWTTKERIKQCCTLVILMHTKVIEGEVWGDKVRVTYCTGGCVPSRRERWVCKARASLLRPRGRSRGGSRAFCDLAEALHA
nr:hypothetical protein CFP56_08055 [Quercus suber]